MILFKSDTEKAQFSDNRLDNRLRIILFALSGYVRFNFGKDIVITSIYREGDTGVHGYWRGIDIRTRHAGIDYFTDEEISKITDYLKNFEYGDNIHNTSLYHDVGQGIHFHIQVSNNNYTKIIKYLHSKRI
jgi:hypothetical protein